MTQHFEVKRSNRRTAVLLWLIVAAFFFGVMIKYYLLAR
ncbi:MAG: cytochrome oxidase small assembly protein [Burkholderiales bacterium]|nr:cytochrome oxidase small assembly protein [Burkholderiales bacterium]